jgi:hypothetical protein
MYEPFPAKTTEIIVGENSNMRTAFVAYPTKDIGIGILEFLKLLYICKATTAPTNIEVNNTKPKEFTPKSLISLIIFLKKPFFFVVFVLLFLRVKSILL